MQDTSTEDDRLVTLLDVRNLHVRYDTADGPLHSVNDVSFTVGDGVNYALSGESASGKSTIAKAVLGLLPDHGHVTAGSVEFDGYDLLALDASERQDLLWEEIAFIPQTAMDALDPVMTVGAQIRQAIQTHRDVTTRNAQRRARELFESVGLEVGRLNEYPHQFSGGMRQRVVIAMALALDPKLIIADEPTTGLDVIVQDKIIDSILAIQEHTESSLLLITHDVGVIAETCDEISVLYGGTVMEQGSVENVLLHPTNPYTMGLKNAFPAPAEENRALVSMPGTPPAQTAAPTGCVFAPRCPFATTACDDAVPELVDLPFRNQRTACHHVETAHEMRREIATTDDEPEPSGDRQPRPADPILEVNDLHAWYEHDRSWWDGFSIDAATASIADLTHNLRKWYEHRGGGLGDAFGGDPAYVRAVDGVSFAVERGEIFGIIGESGCGKTTLGETIALLQSPTAGGFWFAGRSHEAYVGGGERAFRQQLQIIFQNPYDALNPRMTVRQLVSEPLTIHDYRRGDRSTAVDDTLRKVGLTPPERFYGTYPHELSGGQRQRVALARALVLDPDFLICDEPASMLDASLKAEVLNLLRSLVDTERIGVLYISHDIASLTHVADRLGVMYLGRLVERGPTQDVVGSPQHPYTAALLAAVPETSPVGTRDRVVLDGEPPSPVDLQDGCRFAPRCPKATEQCTATEPALDAWRDADTDQTAACYHPQHEVPTETDWASLVDRRSTTD